MVFPLRAQYLILSPKDDEEDSLSVRDTLSDPAKENWQKAKYEKIDSQIRANIEWVLIDLCPKSY